MADLFKVASGSLCAFLIGSLPFSYWVVKLFRGIDIRTLGSGNSGATNVFRTQGKTLGFLALFLDIAKGSVPLLFLYPLFSSQTLLNPFLFQTLMGLCAIAGHSWTPFLGWKGGKGVATSAGVFLALFPLPFFTALAFFLIVFLKTRIISISSLTAVAVFPLAVLIFERGTPHFAYAFLASLLVSIFIFYTHRANIRRLLKGEEKKL